QRRGGRAAQSADGSRLQYRTGAVRVGRASTDGACHGQGRGRLRPLRPLRRALPDGGVGHAEVRPEGSLRRTKRNVGNGGNGGSVEWNKIKIDRAARLTRRLGDATRAMRRAPA